jgi:uncharacterized protein (UPF0305 family)
MSKTRQFKFVPLKGMMAVMFLMVIISACSYFPPMSKNGYLKDFVSFVNDVELNHEKYTDEEWKKSDETFEKYADTYYNKFKEKMNTDDIRKANMLKGKYIGFKIKGKAGNVIKDIMNSFKEILDESSGVIESLKLKADSL